ncbi:unnamed protein product [marine sediment metagenome]|uniref:Tryptophan synthase beta chain-like PALP domain-containing protein n=1 Tax=marine sediment metagenome TaxID=412755 RepID=X0ZN37_9ZZZZ
MKPLILVVEDNLDLLYNLNLLLESNNYKPLNTEIYDKIITVGYDDAVATARKLARLEGIFVGISAGACAWAAIYEASKDFEKGENLVALLPDGEEKYLSTDLFQI